MTAGKLWSPYPNPQQELLLKACLLKGERAVESWKAWRPQITVDQLDFAMQRLLPLLHSNLAPLGITHPDFERYTSVARFVWYENQLRARTVANLLKLFKVAGIPVMILKGCAVGPLYYKSWSLRGASDVDIAVPGAQAMAAARLLHENNWTSPEEASIGSAAYRASIHAAGFKDSQGIELDLHWRVLNEQCSPAADERFWRLAQPLDLNGVRVLTLSDTDHLLHVIIHAMRPNTTTPIRWVADSAMILRNAEIDWSRFAAQAKEGRFSRRLLKALRYLKDQFELPVPAAALTELAAAPASFVESAEEWMSSDDVPSAVRLMGWRYMHYRRIAHVETAPRSFFSYLKTLWGAPNPMATVQMGIDFIVKDRRSARARHE